MQLINLKPKELFQTLHFLVGVIFAFAWVGFSLSISIFIPDILFFILGIIIPLCLLVGVIQYQSRAAYGITILIFLLGIFRNLAGLPGYIELYKIELNGGNPQCSCCPSCEISTILKLVAIFLIAVLMMHHKKMRTRYNWKWIYLIFLAIAALQLHYLIHYLNTY